MVVVDGKTLDTFANTGGNIEDCKEDPQSCLQTASNSIKLTKVDADDHTKTLRGAVFSVINLKANPDASADGENAWVEDGAYSPSGDYNVDGGNGYKDWLLNMQTGSDGVLNLPKKVGTYYVSEVEYPNGYKAFMNEFQHYAACGVGCSSFVNSSEWYKNHPESHSSGFFYTVDGDGNVTYTDMSGSAKLLISGDNDSVMFANRHVDFGFTKVDKNGNPMKDVYFENGSLADDVSFEDGTVGDATYSYDSRAIITGASGHIHGYVKHKGSEIDVFDRPAGVTGFVPPLVYPSNIEMKYYPGRDYIFNEVTVKDSTEYFPSFANESFIQVKLHVDWDGTKTVTVNGLELSGDPNTGGAGAQGNVVVKDNPGKIIQKLDKVTNKPLNGVTFSMITLNSNNEYNSLEQPYYRKTDANEDVKIVKDLTTDANGYLRLPMFPKSTVYICEQDTPDGYTSQRKEGDRLYNSCFEVITDVNGHQTLKNIDFSYDNSGSSNKDYSVKETDEGLLDYPDNPKFYNVPIGFTIKKIDSNTKKPLKDVVFTVKGSFIDGSTSKDVTTDDKGEASVQYLKADQRTVEVKEKTPPHGGYIADPDSRSISIDQYGAITYNGYSNQNLTDTWTYDSASNILTVPNGKYIVWTVKKVDANDDSKTLSDTSFNITQPCPDGDCTGLEGADDTSKTFTNSFTTGTDGTFKFNIFMTSDYVSFLETKAHDGYKLDNKTRKLSASNGLINYDNVTGYTVDRTNHIITIANQTDFNDSLKLKKVGSDNPNVGLSGAVFKFSEMSYDNDRTCEATSKGSVEKTLTTDSDGLIDLTDLTGPNCQFELTETKAPDGYEEISDYDFLQPTTTFKLDSTMNLTKVKDGQTALDYTYDDANHVITVSNTPDQSHVTYVSFRKYDSDNRDDVLSSSETTITMETCDDETCSSVSDSTDFTTENGEYYIETTHLDGSKYYRFSEKTPPTGYAKSDEKIIARMTADGSFDPVNGNASDSDWYVDVSGIRLYDKVDIPFKIKKVDADNHDKPLSGAEFEVHNNSDYSDSFTVTTGDDGIADLSGKLKLNTKYYMYEMTAPKGYNSANLYMNGQNVYMSVDANGKVTLTNYNGDALDFTTDLKDTDWVSLDDDTVTIQDKKKTAFLQFFKVDGLTIDKIPFADTDAATVLEGSEWDLKSTLDADGNSWTGYSKHLTDADNACDWYTADGITYKKGCFQIRGLPYGTYTLTETKAPQGYQIADPVTLKVYMNDNGYTRVSIVNYDPSKAKFVTSQYVNYLNIADYKNTTQKLLNSLPRTGALGIILVVFAGLLIAGSFAYLTWKKATVKY